MYVLIAAFNLLIIIIILLIMKLSTIIRRRKVKRNDKSKLIGIESGISAQLHAVCPDSKWRWVCCPISFASNGGIARIEVQYSTDRQSFMDVCLSTNNYMALHVANVVELCSETHEVSSDNVLVATDERSEIDAHSTTYGSLFDWLDMDEDSESDVSSMGTKFHDKESVIAWYNIVFVGALTNLIEKLSEKGEVCFHIGQDGKAYVERDGIITIEHDFEEMPDMSLWDHIIDKLGEDGLFSEVREGNCIFVSW